MGRFCSLGVGAFVALLAVACTPGMDGEKAEVGDVPAAAIAEAGARDSLSAPLAGGTLHVGESAEGAFTAQRGWIAYEIELTRGPVDVFLHGQAPSFGDPLDTVLWVYGPKKANGKYPGTRLAFNDDAEAGDVGSHLLLDVPAAGTYRIVVSSYDNYFAYPTNVTRGSYALIVKCPRSGEGDVCGPAVHYEGGSCWADAECVGGLHCEGEITCAPGTQCLYVHPGTCVADYAWMTVAPRQCGNNPWMQDPQAGSSPVTVEEGAAVDNYFTAKGMKLAEVGFLHDAVPHVQCLSCACARGDLLLVKASAADAARLTSEYGFARVASATMFSQAPVQCGGNPWDESSDRRAEELSVVSWVGSAQAALERVGFVEKTEAQLVCTSCSCARGDRLVVKPSAQDPGVAANASVLGGLGFVDVYRP
jgi:hypothetical protein